MRRHAVVVGLGYGDEGKGTVVDFLAKQYAKDRKGVIVVRFNGGAQAGHNVYAADGRHHTFSQFGAGHFQGAQTHLSRFSLVDPLALVTEAEWLKEQTVGEPLQRVSVEREALMVTPFHAAANKAIERARGDRRHGSCGMGIGETVAFSLQHPDIAPRVKDAQDPRTLRKKFWALYDYYKNLIPKSEMPPIDLLVEVCRSFANSVRIVDERYLPFLLEGQHVIFEGAQGVLLDQDVGYHPYTTWSKTTPHNALTLLDEAGMRFEAEVIGVTRTYATRHGVGPFPTEDEALTAALPDKHNSTGEWQGSFRVGHLDLPALRYAAACSPGLTSLAVTHADQETWRVKVANEYLWGRSGVTVHALPVPDNRDAQESLTASAQMVQPIYDESLEGDKVKAISDALRLPVLIVSKGVKAKDKTLHDHSGALGRSDLVDAFAYAMAASKK